MIYAKASDSKAVSRELSMCALWRTNSCNCKQDCSPGISSQQFVELAEKYFSGKPLENTKLS